MLKLFKQYLNKIYMVFYSLYGIILKRVSPFWPTVWIVQRLSDVIADVASPLFPRPVCKLLACHTTCSWQNLNCNS